MPDGGAEAGTVGCADVAARQGFARVGKAVHDVREKGEQLHQQRVHGQDDVAVGRAGGGEKHRHCHDAGRSDEDVAVDAEEPFHGRMFKEARLPRMFPQQAVSALPEDAGREQPGILGDERAQGNAGHFHAEDEYEKQARGDVHHVLHDGHIHGNPRILHADEPPREAVRSQDGRCAPDADMEIERGHFPYFRAGVDEGEGCPSDGVLQNQEQGGHCHGHGERAEQDAHALRKVALAIGLRGQPPGSHAEEAEHPVNHVEKHASHGDGPDVGRVAQMACDGHVCQSQQRHGDVGHDGRQGNAEYLFVDGVWHVREVSLQCAGVCKALLKKEAARSGDAQAASCVLEAGLEPAQLQ